MIQFLHFLPENKEYHQILLKSYLWRYSQRLTLHLLLGNIHRGRLFCSSTYGRQFRDWRLQVSPKALPSSRIIFKFSKTAICVLWDNVNRFFIYYFFFNFDFILLMNLTGENRQKATWQRNNFVWRRINTHVHFKIWEQLGSSRRPTLGPKFEMPLFSCRLCSRCKSRNHHLWKCCQGSFRIFDQFDETTLSISRIQSLPFHESRCQMVSRACGSGSTCWAWRRGVSPDSLGLLPVSLGNSSLRPFTGCGSSQKILWDSVRASEKGK